MGIILQNVGIFWGKLVGQVGIFVRRSRDSQPEPSGNTENWPGWLKQQRIKKKIEILDKNELKRNNMSV